MYGDIDDLVAGSSNTGGGFGQEDDPRSTLKCRVGGAEIAADVAEPSGAQEGIDDRMRHSITVGMAVKPFGRIRPLEPRKPQRPTDDKAMDVGPDSDARRVHTSIMPYREATFRSPRDDRRVIYRYSPAFAGIVAVGAGLASTELLAGVLNVRASPVVALGETVIAWTPGMIAHTIISMVGHADKPLAIASVVMVIGVLGALLGMLWVRRRVMALMGVIVLSAVAMAMVLSRPDTGTLVGVLCLVGGAVTIVGLDSLTWGDAHETDGQSRRKFIRNASIVAVGSVVAAGLGRLAGHSRAVVENARARLRLPTEKIDTPAGTDLGIAGLQPWRTSPKDFYRIDTALAVPLIEPDSWQLRIHGMVDKTLTLSYQDLLDRGLSDAWVTLCCVSNEVGGSLIGNSIWSGVPIKSILDEVGIQSGADALLSTSKDGWTAGTPLAALTDGRNALLAVAMNGEPLPIEHGFPVRQVVPGLYGYVSATKWVTDWEITKFSNFSAYWTDRGWSEKGPIKTESRIDTPSRRAKAGPVKVAGSAWAQHRGITAVEVRVDGGPWSPARLAKVPNLDTWVQWVWDWDATPGDHRLEVRATDATGTPQTSQRANVVPNGASGYDGRLVTVTA